MQVSTNMPGIGLVFRKIGRENVGNFEKTNHFFFCYVCSMAALAVLKRQTDIWAFVNVNDGDIHKNC